MPEPLWVRRLQRATAVFLILALFGLTALVPFPARADEDDDHVADELLVGFHDHVATPQAEAVYHAEGAAKLSKLGRVNVHRIQLHPAALRALEQRLRHLPEVKFVERNRRIPVALVPNDPAYGEQWHLARIRAPQAWDITPGSPGIVIGILDSGIDSSHPDLASKLLPGWNFYEGNANTGDVTGHGTRVAGVAAAISNNGIGVAGVAMQSLIMPLRVTDNGGTAYYSTVANALTWAVDHGVKVMNLSFDGIARSSVIREAAQYVRSRGGVVVAAAGNCSCFDATPPNTHVISVSSTDGADTISWFSSRGNHIDLAAPGENIRTTERGGGYSVVGGTSFSSPITAGVMALMMAANPSLTPSELEQLLKANADDLGSAGWDTSYGFGRLNASRAVTAAAGSSPDITAPTVAITAPTGGIVSGTVPVLVNAISSVGISRVELWVGSTLAATSSNAPWSLAWNSTGLANGSYSLVVRAYDAAGNVATSLSVSVMLDNTPSGGTPALALAFAGFARDRVSQSASAPVPDGAVDGAFTLTRAPGSGARRITRLDLRRVPQGGAPRAAGDDSGIWDTVPSSFYWSLGVARSLDDPLLNDASGAVNFPLGAGGSVTLFAADAAGFFAPGSSFTVTAEFADGSTATASATIPAGPPSSP
jgi:thermitase